MTPLEISILIHYATSGEDFRSGDFTAPAVRNAIDSFRDDKGLLERSENTRQTYKITPRGRAFIDHVCSLPLPVCTWHIPVGELEQRLSLLHRSSGFNGAPSLQAQIMQAQIDKLNGKTP